MIGIYERSLCQSYASAYRAGIKIGEAETRKAIGNSMAVPVMRFIGERIAMAEAGEIA